MTEAHIKARPVARDWGQRQERDSPVGLSLGIRQP